MEVTMSKDAFVLDDATAIGHIYCASVARYLQHSKDYASVGRHPCKPLLPYESRLTVDAGGGGITPAKWA